MRLYYPHVLPFTCRIGCAQFPSPTFTPCHVLPVLHIYWTTFCTCLHGPAIHSALPLTNFRCKRCHLRFFYHDPTRCLHATTLPAAQLPLRRADTVTGFFHLRRVLTPRWDTLRILPTHLLHSTTRGRWLAGRTLHLPSLPTYTVPQRQKNPVYRLTTLTPFGYPMPFPRFDPLPRYVLLSTLVRCLPVACSAVRAAAYAALHLRTRYTRFCRAARYAPHPHPCATRRFLRALHTTPTGSCNFTFCAGSTAFPCVTVPTFTALRCAVRRYRRPAFGLRTRCCGSCVTAYRHSLTFHTFPLLHRAHTRTTTGGRTLLHAAAHTTTYIPRVMQARAVHGCGLLHTHGYLVLPTLLPGRFGLRDTLFVCWHSAGCGCGFTTLCCLRAETAALYSSTARA